VREPSVSDPAVTSVIVRIFQSCDCIQSYRSSKKERSSDYLVTPGGMN
jgi:hypothetical protein